MAATWWQVTRTQRILERTSPADVIERLDVMPSDVMKEVVTLSAKLDFITQKYGQLEQQVGTKRDTNDDPFRGKDFDCWLGRFKHSNPDLIVPSRIKDNTDIMVETIDDSNQ